MSTRPNILSRFWLELQRRKVFKVLAMYAGSAFVIIQVIDILAAPLNLPSWIMTLIIILLSTGFPLAAILAWIFDLTPEGIKKTESLEELADKEILTAPSRRRLKASDIIISVLAIAVIILAWPKIFKRDSLDRLRSSGEKINIAVMQFQNMTKDTAWSGLENAIRENLISSLANIAATTGELGVRQKETMDQLFQGKGFTENAGISPSILGTLAKKLETDIFLVGNIQKAGPLIRIDTKLIDTKTNDVIKSFLVEIPAVEENFIPIVDSLGRSVVEFLRISRLIKGAPEFLGRQFLTTNSSEAISYSIRGYKAWGKFDISSATKWFERALEVDSNFLAPMFALSTLYSQKQMPDKAMSMLLKLYRKRDQMSYIDKLNVEFRYARVFKPPEEQIEYLKLLQEIDDQGNYHYALANAYSRIKQPDKALAEMEKSLEVSRKWGREFLKEHYAYAALGEAYHRTGQYKKEKRLYREARRVNDDQRSEYFSWIIRNQASLALTEGDTVSANRYIKELKSVFREISLPEYNAASYFSTMYRMGGYKDKGIEYLRKALGLAAGDPDKMNGIAWILIDRDLAIDEGLEIIDKALVLRPDNYIYLDTKGWGLYKQGKYREALELLEKALELNKPAYSYGIVSHIEEVKKAIAGQK